MAFSIPPPCSGGDRAMTLTLRPLMVPQSPQDLKRCSSCRKRLPLEQFSGSKATCSKCLLKKRKSRNTHNQTQEALTLRLLAGSLRDVVERHRQTILLLAQGEAVDVPSSLIAAEAAIPAEFRAWMMTGMVHDLDSGLMTGPFDIETPAPKRSATDPLAGLSFELDELYDDGMTSSGSSHGVGCSSGLNNHTDILSTPQAPAAPDTAYFHEVVSKASSFPSPWCLQFEPVVEGAFLAWRGRQQFLGLCVTIGIQLITALTSLVQPDTDYEDDAFESFSVSGLVDLCVGGVFQNSVYGFYLLAVLLLLGSQFSQWLSNSEFRVNERQARWLGRGIMVLMLFHLFRVVWVESHDEEHTRTPQRILEKIIQTQWRVLCSAILLRPSPIFQVCWMAGLLLSLVGRDSAREALSHSVARLPVLPLALFIVVLLFWLSFWERKHFVEVLQASGAAPTRREDSSRSISARVRRLVQMVLEGGDELCTSSTEALQKLVRVLKLEDARWPHDGELNPLSESSASQAGRGTGSATKTNQLDDDDEKHLESFWSEVLSGTPGAADFDSSVGGSSQPSSELPVPTARNDEPRSFAEELLSMIYESCAVVDPRSGALLWRNRCFNELALRVGEGNAWTGQKVLYSQFLTGIPRGVDHCRTCNFSEAPSLRLVSTARLVEAPHTSRVLWTIRLTEVGSSLLPQPGCTPPTGAIADRNSLPAFADLADSTQDDHTEYPAAAEYTNPTTMILTHSGSGYRQASLLWRRYGRKSVSLIQPGAWTQRP
eukprot:TRINITY_DN19756_c0_g3_i17.p1 TRINITY_DN19756_c0_g3~~TRINITY_DN19756_c0_g3_i17.p1  ORF type:complete len:770 (-),score=86.59 TRINITY_DN19756_c0_g3_i17:556-2865(-)